MKTMMMFLHEDETIRQVPCDEPFEMEVLIPETGIERSLMFALICETINLCSADIYPFEVNEQGIWTGDLIGRFVVWRDKNENINDTPDGVVKVWAIHAHQTDGQHCYLHSDPRRFPDGFQQMDMAEDMGIDVSHCQTGDDGADDMFREMSPLKKKLFIDSAIRTMSAEFGADRNEYRKWEQGFIEVCRANKDVMFDVVAECGISRWFLFYSCGVTPEQAYGWIKDGSAEDRCNVLGFSSLQRPKHN